MESRQSMVVFPCWVTRHVAYTKSKYGLVYKEIDVIMVVKARRHRPMFKPS